MADGKIYITISDARTGEVIKDTNITVGKDPKEKKKKQQDNEDEFLLGRYAEHEMFHMIKNTVTQTVNFEMSNIGNFTGDYITQRRVNQMRQQISGITSIGMATLAGAKVAGVAGAAVGFLIGAYSTISGSIFESIVAEAENAKVNYSIEQLRKRSGLNSIYDGSRGTQN